MSKYLLLGLLVVCIAVGTYIGCDGARARMGVAQDKAIAQIDKLLGEIDVKQKKVENAFNELKEASAGLREKRIEAKVRVKNLTEKKAKLVEEKGKLLKDLASLKQMLGDAESTGSIKRGERDVTVAELKSLADRTIKKMGLVKDQIVKNDVIAAAWAKNLGMLSKNDDTSQSQLAKLSSQLDQIRSKKSALDAMKEAATIAGPGASISDKFNDLTAEVDELLVNLDTEWEIEQMKLDERANDVEMESSLHIEDLLDDKANIDSTMSDIDKLLQEEGQ